MCDGELRAVFISTFICFSNRARTAASRSNRFCQVAVAAKGVKVEAGKVEVGKVGKVGKAAKARGTRDGENGGRRPSSL
jgi:hypothetical protein